MKTLREVRLLSSQTFCAEHGSPRWCRMPASHELLINLLVTYTAVCRRNVRRNLKTVVVDFVLFLSFLRLMAIEARNTLRRVLAHFKFVDNRILLPRVAFRAFSRRLDEFGVGLIHCSAWPRAVYQQSSNDQRKRNHDRDEHGSKGHR